MGFVEDPELEKWKRAHAFPPIEGGASESYWRESARVVIDKILDATKGMDPEDRIKAIDKGYPFVERKGLPFQIWLIERRGALVELAFIKYAE